MPLLPSARRLANCFLPLLLAVSACAPGQEGQDDGYEPVPLEAGLTNTKPLTGIVLWTTNSKRTRDWVQMEYSYMLYSDICSQQDVFDWMPMDALLEDVASRGHQLIVRFRYTYVGMSCAVPQYIKDLPGYEATWGKSEGRNTEFPDWRCEALRDFHMDFYRRFAERYDNDPRLAYLETGFGLWAEYHIYDGPFVLGRTFPSKAFQAEFLRAMDTWFVSTPWCISVDAASSSYGPFRSDKSLLELGFGNFDDSFMCEEYEEYNARNWRFFGEDRYKRAPLGGEFSYYTDYDQRHCLDPGGIYGRVFENEVAKYHMTFIIGDGQPRYQSDDRIREAAMAMGYRFEVRDFRVKAGTGASVTVANTGVAPIYHAAFPAVDGVRSSFDLRSLMPGEEQTVLIPLPSASASSVLTIECDRLLPGVTIPYDVTDELKKS